MGKVWLLEKSDKLTTFLRLECVHDFQPKVNTHAGRTT